MKSLKPYVLPINWKACSALILLFTITTVVKAQLTTQDIAILGSAATTEQDSLNSTQIIEKDGRKGPIYWSYAGLLWTYQNGISPYLSGECAYEMSCSNYAKTAISDYGFLVGLFMGADRLSRCNHLAIKDLPPIRKGFNQKGDDLPHYHRH